MSYTGGMRGEIKRVISRRGAKGAKKNTRLSLRLGGKFFFALIPLPNPKYQLFLTAQF
jgi:hypothetical protein